MAFYFFKKYIQHIRPCNSESHGLKMQSSSQKKDTSRPRPRHGHKYAKNKLCLSIMMVIRIMQHLSDIWNSVHENVKQTWEKRDAYKKACNS